MNFSVIMPPKGKTSAVGGGNFGGTASELPESDLPTLGTFIWFLQVSQTIENRFILLSRNCFHIGPSAIPDCH